MNSTLKSCTPTLECASGSVPQWEAVNLLNPFLSAWEQGRVRQLGRSRGLSSVCQEPTLWAPKQSSHSNNFFLTMEVVSYLIRCLCCGCHALGLSSLTSLFMYPSLLMSYKLNVHLSFSWTVPLSKIDRAVTKSWEGEEAWVTLTTKPSGGGSSVFGSNPVTAYTEWHHSCSLSPER